MTATITDTKTDLEILTDLDFDPEHACEHPNHGKVPWHGGPAKYLVAESYECPACHRASSEGFTLALCAPAWEKAGSGGIGCPTEGCKHSWPRDEVWTIIAVFE